MPTHARLLLVVTLCCSLVARAVAFASTETKAAANADAGAAPPPSPVVRVAQKHRYLLYDVIFHEQVNKQRRALMFYLDLAMKLKRTLVLPRTRLLRKARHGFNFDSNADYVGWGELYNVSTLSRLHPVMELDQYVALHGEQVTLHVNNNNQLCKADSKGATQVDYNGRLFDAEYSICSKGLQYETNRLLSHQFTGEESIAFGNSVDQLGMDSALTLRPWVRFEQEIYDKAAAYVKKTFRGAPFLSIHWRRTDFLQVRRSQPGVLQSAEMLISHAKRLMKRHGLKHVYLATDCDNADELSIVERALKPARFMPGSTRAAISLLKRTQAANVEIAIAAMADYFLGTQTSSFTLAITEEREAIFGKSRDTADEMRGDPLKDEL